MFGESWAITDQHARVCRGIDELDKLLTSRQYALRRYTARWWVVDKDDRILAHGLTLMELIEDLASQKQ